MKTIFEKPLSVERKWYVIDADGKALGRVAVKVAYILRGKNKAYYTPHQEIGDYVIVINAEKAALSGKKRTDKLYYRHSGFLGGLKAETYDKVVARKSTMPMEKAIRGMLPKGPLGNKLYTNVKIYAGAEHPHAAQQATAVEV